MRQNYNSESINLTKLLSEFKHPLEIYLKVTNKEDDFKHNRQMLSKISCINSNLEVINPKSSDFFKLFFGYINRFHEKRTIQR